MALFLTEEKDINVNQPISKVINKNDNSVEIQKKKPIKRKTVDYPGEKEQKIDDLFININKCKEEEKIEAEKNENMNSENSESQSNLEFNSKNIEKTEYGKKRAIYPEEEKEKCTSI